MSVNMNEDAISAILVFFSSMLPIIELKGGIIFGVGRGLPLWETFFISLAGACFPVPFILLLFKPIMAFMRRTKLVKRLVHFIDAKVHKSSRKVTGSKYALLALFIFVAIPLPTTGVWTGSAIASFMNMRFLRALPAIIGGNIVAGLVMLLFSSFFFGI